MRKPKLATHMERLYGEKEKGEGERKMRERGRERARERDSAAPLLFSPAQSRHQTCE